MKISLLTLWTPGLRHKILTTDSLELKFHIYNLEVARNPKMLKLIGWKRIQCCYLPLGFQNKTKQNKQNNQHGRSSEYKWLQKPQCKKFLKTDEVLTQLFNSDNDSDGSEISFDSETTSSEEYFDVVPTLVDVTKLEEPCFRDTLLDIDLSSLFCLLCSISIFPK